MILLLTADDREAVEIIERLCIEQGVDYDVRGRSNGRTFEWELWANAPLTPTPVAA